MRRPLHSRDWRYKLVLHSHSHSHVTRRSHHHHHLIPLSSALVHQHSSASTRLDITALAPYPISTVQQLPGPVQAPRAQASRRYAGRKPQDAAHQNLASTCRLHRLISWRVLSQEDCSLRWLMAPDLINILRTAFPLVLCCCSATNLHHTSFEKETCCTPEMSSSFH